MPEDAATWLQHHKAIAEQFPQLVDEFVDLEEEQYALCWLEDSDMQLEEDERKVDDVVDEKRELKLIPYVRLRHISLF